MIPEQPTPDQLSTNAKVYVGPNKTGYAMYYPQMGGYGSAAVATWYTDDENPCIDVYVWHNGDFPFHKGENPAILHHCLAAQFTEFGKLLERLIA